MADIASLSVKLGLVTVEWDAATEKAKRQAKDLRAAFDNLGSGFGKAAEMWRNFGSLISVSAIAALAHETAAFADEVLDLGVSYQLTTQQVLAFRDALTASGLSADNASKILSSLYSKIDEGRQGNDKTIAQFEKLGITFTELKNMTTYEAIQKVAKGFENVADAFERTKMIKEFFGKGGIGVGIEQINEALAQGTERYDDYAEGLKRVSVVTDNLKRNFDNLKIAFADIMKYFVGDHIASVQTFSAALKAIATGAIIGGVLSLALAFGKLALAIHEARIAGTAFNLIAGPNNPLGIAIKLLTIGATAIVFFAGTVDNSEAIAKQYLKNPNIGKIIGDQAHKNLLFTKEPNATEPEKKVEDNPEVKAKKAQLALLRQIYAIDQDRNRLNAEAFALGESQTQIRKLELDLSERIAQIEAKKNQDLLAAKDNTTEYKNQIKSIAQQEIETAKKNTEAQKELIRQTAERAYIQQKAAYTLRGIEHAGYDEATKAAESNIQERINQLYQMGKASDEQVRQIDLANQRLEAEQKLLNAMPKEREYMMQIYDINAQILEFERQQRLAGRSDEDIKTRSDELRKVLNRQLEIKEATKEEQESFVYGWNEAFRQYVESSTNAALIANQSFNSIISNMNSAIETFVRTGKLSFGDLTDAILRDLYIIQMKAQAVKIFDYVQSSAMSGVQGMMGLLGKRQGEPAPVENRDFPRISNFFDGVPSGMAMADGGTPPVGLATLVGEQGPELFVPKTAGTIIPNNSLSSVMGNNAPTVNYNGPYIANMSAIDTQSGIQFLAKNKQTIWASYQSANRSVPVSR